MAQQEGERADVVLVAVGEEDRPHLLAPLDEPGEVGGDDVDAERLVGEEDAAVDDRDPAGGLDGEAVHAHLAEAAERDDADRGWHGGSLAREGTWEA